MNVIGFENNQLLSQLLCVLAGFFRQGIPSPVLQENREDKVCLLEEHKHSFKVLPLQSISQGMENALNSFVL